jgi:two-component system sensor histidine kinase DesK
MERSGETSDRSWMTMAEGGRRWRWAMVGVFWLLFLAPLVTKVIHADQPVVARALTLLAIAAFVVLYLTAVPLTAIRPMDDPLRYVAVAAALLLGLATAPVGGEASESTFVYIAVVAVGLLRPRIAAPIAAGVALLAIALSYGVPGWSNDPWGLVFSVFLASVATMAFVRLIRRNYELAAAREGLAAMAVEQERARFARDLHDLLGHSLTVITVKSELAGRLMARDPERAAREVADIERLAREALADVRSTVAGYREVTLATELSAARSALTAAGITAELPGALDEVPGARRELFGWVVREGVTNVVRHSDAHLVRVMVSPTTVEVVDDGSGCCADDLTGNGLLGLRERLSAAGGRLEAGPADGGGFRLYAEVPA